MSDVNISTAHRRFQDFTMEGVHAGKSGNFPNEDRACGSRGFRLREAEAKCSGGFRGGGASRLRPPPLGRRTDAVAHGHLS